MYPTRDHIPSYMHNHRFRAPRKLESSDSGKGPADYFNVWSGPNGWQHTSGPYPSRLAANRAASLTRSLTRVGLVVCRRKPKNVGD